MRLFALTSAALVAFAAFALVATPAAATPCGGPNEAVMQDVMDTAADPTHPQCGSLSDPCYDDEWGCGGCGPDHVEWIIGPIYCP